MTKQRWTVPPKSGAIKVWGVWLNNLRCLCTVALASWVVTAAGQPRARLG